MKCSFKYTLFFSLICLGFTGCEKPYGDRQMTDKNYSIIVIDGCEYIECDYGFSEARVYSLTHKGNCKNKIHKYTEQ